MLKKVRCVIRERIKLIIRGYFPIIESVYMIILGNGEIKKIRNKYGSDVHIIFMFGATGDTYIQLRIIHNYLEERDIKNYVLTGNPQGIREIIKLFPQYKFHPMRDYVAASIQKLYMLMSDDLENFTVMFPWTYELYANRCRIRMTEKFNFMDTYCWYVLNLKQKYTLASPQFLKLTPALETKYKTIGINKGKTIILAPEANSVTTLDSCLWKEIIEALQKCGYTVFINAREGKYGCKNLFLPYFEYGSLLEYAGFFIGVRSGLCDIISSIVCKKIIIYPQKTDKVNYNEHRSEIDFCGLKVMGLVKQTDSNLVEIDTKLVRNITQKENNIKDNEEYIQECKLLKHNILMNL